MSAVLTFRHCIFCIFLLSLVLYLSRAEPIVCPIDLIKTILSVSESDWRYDWLIINVSVNAQFIPSTPEAHPNKYSFVEIPPFRLIGCSIGLAWLSCSLACSDTRQSGESGSGSGDRKTVTARGTGGTGAGTLSVRLRREPRIIRVSGSLAAHRRKNSQKKTVITFVMYTWWKAWNWKVEEKGKIMEIRSFGVTAYVILFRWKNST